MVHVLLLGQAHVPDLRHLQDQAGASLVIQDQIRVKWTILVKWTVLIHQMKSVCSWIRSVNSNSRLQRCLSKEIIQAKILEAILINFSLMNKGFCWSVMCPILWPRAMPCSSCLKGGHTQLIISKVIITGVIIQVIIEWSYYNTFDKNCFANVIKPKLAILFYSCPNT